MKTATTTAQAKTSRYTTVELKNYGTNSVPQISVRFRKGTRESHERAALYRLAAAVERATPVNEMWSVDIKHTSDEALVYLDLFWRTPRQAAVGFETLKKVAKGWSPHTLTLTTNNQATKSKAAINNKPLTTVELDNDMCATPQIYVRFPEGTNLRHKYARLYELAAAVETATPPACDEWDVQIEFTVTVDGEFIDDDARVYLEMVGTPERRERALAVLRNAVEAW